MSEAGNASFLLWKHSLFFCRPVLCSSPALLLFRRKKKNRLTKNDFTSLFVHALNHCQRLYPIAFFPQQPAARLLPLLYDNPDAFHNCTGAFDQINQPVDRTAVCQKIVDRKSVV